LNVAQLIHLVLSFYLNEVIDMKMSNKVYDVLKLISLIATPLVTLIMALTEIWGFKYGAEIAASVSAVGALVGTILTKSSYDYKVEQIMEKHDNNLGE